MDAIIRTAAFALAITAIGLAIKRNNPELTLLLTVSLAAVVLYMAIDAIGGILDFMREISEMSDISGAALNTVLKTVAIALITRLSSDICRDAGQTAVASAVETVGTAGAVYVALPLMRTVLKTVIELT